MPITTTQTDLYATHKVFRSGRSIAGIVSGSYVESGEMAVIVNDGSPINPCAGAMVVGTAFGCLIMIGSNKHWEAPSRMKVRRLSPTEAVSFVAKL